jgi:hypothetical protein
MNIQSILKIKSLKLKNKIKGRKINNQAVELNTVHGNYTQLLQEKGEFIYFQTSTQKTPDNKIQNLFFYQITSYKNGIRNNLRHLVTFT